VLRVERGEGGRCGPAEPHSNAEVARGGSATAFSSEGKTSADLESGWKLDAGFAAADILVDSMTPCAPYM
jgi:hypothetical protein